MTNRAEQAERLGTCHACGHAWELHGKPKCKAQIFHDVFCYCPLRPIPAPEERSKIIDDLAKEEVAQGTYFRVPHKSGCLYSQAYGVKCTCGASGQEEMSAGKPKDNSPAVSKWGSSGYIAVQYWLAELDQYGNPKLIDGMHRHRSGVVRAMDIYRTLGFDKGRKFALAKVELSSIYSVEVPRG